MTIILKNTIDTIIDSCTSTIDTSIRHVGNDVGWHQHLGSKKVGIVATSIALLYYHLVEKECPEKDACIKFLLTKQNDDGGWSYISNMQGKSNVESTCWVLQALNEYLTDENNTIIKSAIKKGIDWLLQQPDNAIIDKGWPFSKGSVPRIYTTAFTLRTLLKIGEVESQQFESAKQWLLDAQNDDGGWGELPEKGSSCFYTSYVIITLIELGLSVSDPKITKASLWLQNRFKEVPMYDSTFLCYLEFIESGEGETRARISSFHYVLPYVAQALMALGVFNDNLIQAITILNERAREGYVEHPMLENTRIKPIWAIYDSICADIEFKKRINNWNKQFEFLSICNKLVSLKRWNPLRFFFRYMSTIITFVISFGLLFLLIKQVNWDVIQKWWMDAQDKTLGQIIISFVGSFLVVIVSKVMEIVMRLKNK